MKYRRCLLKLSGKAFGSSNNIFNFEFMNKIASQLKKVHEKGHQIVLVIGGGNICRAKDFISKIGKESQISLDYAGMLSSVINGLIFLQILRINNLDGVLMSSLSVDQNIAQKYNYAQAQKILNNNKILIIVAGAGITHCSTDFVAFLKGLELDVDLFLFAKYKINGIYDRDPLTNKNALKITKTTYQEMLQKKLQFIDLHGLAFCVEKKITIPMFVFDIFTENSIVNTILKKGEYSIVTN